MRSLKMIEHVSLDGVAQHTADGTDFPYDGWTGPYRTPEGAATVLAAHGDRFDLLLGRRTYDVWSEFWPAAPSGPMSDRLNAATKFVVTHRPDGLEWGPAEAVTDLVDGVGRLKATEGPDLVLTGSTTITSPLLDSGLVDEVLLILYPVLLGTGKRMFADGTPARSLELVDTTSTPSGIVLATYRDPAR